MSNPILLILIIFNLIFNVNIATGVLIRGNENVQIINKRDFETDLQHLVVDRFTGNIFIGGRNTLHHLTPSLDTKSSERTGPKTDRQCSYANCPSNAFVDNVNKVLLIDYNSNRLIVCGTFQGYCFIRSLQNMSPEQDAFHPIVSDSENASTVAFIAPDAPTKMYLAVTLNGKSQYGINIPSISARSLEDGQMFTITSLYLTPGTLFNKTLRKLYVVNYVYGFGSEGFSYFVNTQQKSSLSLVRKEYITKLFRVCHNDPLYYSYTELQLECIADDINYNLIQAAYVGKSGADLAEKLGITEKDDVLYAVFSQGRDNIPSNRSAICVYSLSSIRKAFQKNIQDCYNGIGTRGAIDKPCIWSNLYHIGEDFCGSEINYPIIGIQPLTSKPIATFNKRLTAITAAKINNDTVMYVGTVDGHLKKMLYESGSVIEFADIEIHENTPINADLRFDQEDLNLYVLTKNRVTKVSVYNCAIYSKYEDCITSNDPYCGWCSLTNKCSLQSYCDVADNLDRFDPIVIDFNPKLGPISGGTLINIVGNHFNHGQSLKAYISDIPCVVLNHTDTEAVCRTTPSFMKFTGKFHVKFDSIDRECKHGEFHFENDPTIISVISGLNGKKAKGIPSGGIKIYVRGTNFHSIQMPQFYVIYNGKSFYSQCKVLSQTQMLCLSPTIHEEDDYDQLQMNDDSIKLDFGFVMDDVDNVRRITDDIQKFKLCPNPFYEEFPNVKVITDEYVIIIGKNLNCACEEDDVFVLIGEHPCSVTSLSRQQLTCRPQSDVYNLNENQKVMVKVGESLTLDIGFVRFSSVNASNSTDQITSDITTEIETTKPLKKTASRYMKYFIFGIIALILILAGSTAYLCLRIKRERKLTRKLKAAGFASFEEGRPESINPDLALDEQAELLPYDRKYEFPREKLKLGMQIGAGAFGVVLKGIAHGITPYESETVVAVKMVKRMSNDEVMKALVSELKIMVHLGQHLNIVNLLGAVTRDIAQCNLMVIVEYCQYGNLQTFLIKNRKQFIDQIDRENDVVDSAVTSQGPHYENLNSKQLSYANLQLSQNESKNNSDGVSVINSAYNRDSKVLYSSTGINSANTEVTTLYRSGHSDNRITSNTLPESEPPRSVTTTDLLCWSFQITRGMQYLTSRKVIHGDLAARNILLSNDNVVKICDFGLARSLYKTDIYRKEGEDPLPVKWLALESISDHVFSTKTDAWSFGIVMWELFSLGKIPYPGLSGAHAIYSMLQSGYRMEKPQYATQNIYDIMLSCWRVNPESRPMFDELERSISVFLESDVVEHYIDLNDPYLEANINNINEGKTDYIAMMGAPDFYAPQMPNYVNTSIVDEPLTDGLTFQQVSENSPDVQFESEPEEEEEKVEEIPMLEQPRQIIQVPSHLQN